MAATGVVGCHGPAQAQAQAPASTGEFSLRPVRPETAGARDRAYVVRTVRPGDEFTDRLEAVNLTDGPIDLDIAAVDASVAADGSFAPGTQRQATGAWLEASPPQVRVPARGTVPVEVRVRVPADAEPGDHIGAFVAQKSGPPPSGSGVHVVQRVGVRVYLTVERPEGGVAGTRSFELRSLRWVGAPAARTFEAEVVNTGALLVEPLGTLTLGHGDFRTDADIPVLGIVPGGETRLLRFSVPGELEPGTYEARLRLREVNGGAEQEQQVTFTVGPATAAVPHGESDRFPLVPGAVALLVLLAVLTLLRFWPSDNAPERDDTLPEP